MNRNKPWMTTIVLCSCALAAPCILWFTSSTTFDPVVFLSKPLDGSNAEFNPKDPTTILALILGALGASVSSAGGMGGGGLFVPMFNLLLRFNTRTSAILSNFMIFGGMVANMLWSSFQRDPFDPNRPLIDFDAALLMQPNMLLGISLGVLCNLMFPGWLITLLLTVTLGFVTVRTLRCGRKMWRVETARRGEPLAEEDDSGWKVDIEEALLQQDEKVAAEAESSDHEEVRVTELASSWACCVGLPITKFIVLLVVWLFFFAVQLFRGSKTSEGYFHLKVCGTGYWLITASQLPITLVFTSFTVWRAHKDSASDDVKRKFTHSKVSLALPVMALLAGVLGGLLGIGGGMLISPVLMEMGMPPQVTAATSAFMVFFSSSLSVVQYWLMGRIPVDYALWFSAICFVFSLVGLMVVQRVIRRFGRASIIVFLVASVMGLSAMLMAGFGGLDVWNQYANGVYMGFRSPC